MNVSEGDIRVRSLWFVGLALLCVACGGSSGGGSTGPAPVNNTVQVPGLMTTGRFTSAVALKSGDVLEVAGIGSLNAVTLASAEVYHPKTNSFTQVSNQLCAAAERVCLATLPDGTALEAGGLGNMFHSLSQAEVYDPGTNSFRPTVVR